MQSHPSSDNGITVAIFAKPPVPGEVKTRLIPVLGADGAAQLAMAFLVDALAVVRICPWAKPVVATTGPFPLDELEVGVVPLWQQGDGDLGVRIERIVHKGLSEGDRAVIAFGADSPGLPSSALYKARAVLETHEAVLGPSHDGGYYLIGLRRCPHGLLDGIRWSVPETFGETKARLLSAGLSCGLGVSYFDIDTPDDLPRLEEGLRNGTLRAPATAEALKALGRI
jgi:rSAM/selenodomain-associated transferase 1